MALKEKHEKFCQCDTLAKLSNVTHNRTINKSRGVCARSFDSDQPLGYKLLLAQHVLSCSFPTKH